MDGVRVTSRSLTEIPAFSCVAYNEYRNRMVGCSRGNLLTVEDRTDGDNVWEYSCSWQAECEHVVQAAWAHNEFGQVLAVCSSSGDVIVYEERVEGDGVTWISKAQLHHTTSTINDLQFAPKQMGLCLAAACGDGHVRLYKASDVLSPSDWFLDNAFCGSSASGVLSIKWRPWTTGVPPMMILGCTDGAAVWVYVSTLNAWGMAAQLTTSGPVVSVDWAPAGGRSQELLGLAVGRQVTLFSCKGPANKLEVSEVAVLSHSAPVWKLEWNLLGNWLATSTEDSKVCLWRPDMLGAWNMMHHIDGTDQPQDVDMM